MIKPYYESNKWVKVPSLSSSTNTTIYIWYNKAGESQPAEDNTYGKENVRSKIND